MHVSEIGSVTKIFTALLLAEMVQRGEVKLGNPVAKYLPSTVYIHEGKGHPITLVDLAPRRLACHSFPPTFHSTTVAVDAGAKYIPRQLYDFLSVWSPMRDTV